MYTPSMSPWKVLIFEINFVLVIVIGEFIIFRFFVLGLGLKYEFCADENPPSALLVVASFSDILLKILGWLQSISKKDN